MRLWALTELRAPRMQRVANIGIPKQPPPLRSLAQIGQCMRSQSTPGLARRQNVPCMVWLLCRDVQEAWGKCAHPFA